MLLASSSPRRRRLLALGDWTFGVASPEIDETPLPHEPPRDYVLRLAKWKARAAAKAATVEQIVLAADTTVVDSNQILGKPADASEATEVLLRLRGRAHQVMTGIAALRIADDKLLTDVCITDVPMREYTDTEVAEYVRSGDPLDKAGSYAIHHPVFEPVRDLRGCYASVMGLPMCHVARLLKQFDLPPAADVPSRCQAELSYACPIWPAVLRGEQFG